MSESPATLEHSPTTPELVISVPPKEQERYSQRIQNERLLTARFGNFDLRTYPWIEHMVHMGNPKNVDALIRHGKDALDLKKIDTPHIAYLIEDAQTENLEQVGFGAESGAAFLSFAENESAPDVLSASNPWSLKAFLSMDWSKPEHLLRSDIRKWMDPTRQILFKEALTQSPRSPAELIQICDLLGSSDEARRNLLLLETKFGPFSLESSIAKEYLDVVRHGKPGNLVLVLNNFPSVGLAHFSSLALQDIVRNGKSASIISVIRHLKDVPAEMLLKEEGIVYLMIYGDAEHIDHNLPLLAGKFRNFSNREANLPFISYIIGNTHPDILSRYLDKNPHLGIAELNTREIAYELEELKSA